jgi:Tol biopolymer transport system component
MVTAGSRQLKIVPIGAGEPRAFEIGNLTLASGAAAWTPDDKRIIFLGAEPGRGRRLFAKPTVGGSPVPITPEGVRIGNGRPPVVSPDSRFVAAIDGQGKAWRYPLDGGSPLPLPGLAGGDAPLQWSLDGRSIWVLAKERSPALVFRIDIATGNRTRWREIADADPAGLDPGWFRLWLSADGQSYVYGYKRTLSDLYLVDRLK